MQPQAILLLAIIALSFVHTRALAQSTLPKAEHDSLWAVWSDPAQADTNRLKAISKFTGEGYLDSQPDSARYYAALQYDFAAAKGLTKHMAAALNIQAVSFFRQGDYPKALDYFQRGLNISEESGDKRRTSASLNNIGIIYHDLGDYSKALDHFNRSLTISENFEDKKGIANTLNNIGLIYSNQGDHPKALDLYQRCLEIQEEIGDKIGISNSLNNIGAVYHRQKEYLKALDHYQRSLKVSEMIGDKQLTAMALDNIGIIYSDQGDYHNALEHYRKSLSYREAINNRLGMVFSYHSLGSLMNHEKNHQMAVGWCERSLKLAEEMEAINHQKEACECLYDAYKAMGRDKKALVYLEKISELDRKLNREETTKKLQQMEFQQVMLQDSIAKAEEARLVQEAHQEEVRKTTRTRNVFAVSGTFFVLLAGGLYSRSRYIQRSRAVLQIEKNRSENLLLNILPAEIAEELKQKGRADARDYELVSILFSDFKDFTEHSATMSAPALVHEINHCFEAFDGIMVKYGIEKIKTIGDAYMAAGGLPVPSEDSVRNTVLAALEMQAFITKRKAEKDALGEPAFEMRVGIHTGPVVAGIVGVKKFQYDIWGDTVNTASRMESSGVVGQVNISENTHALLKDAKTPSGEPIFQFKPRGRVIAKGKGELEMFLVHLSEENAPVLEEL